MESSDLLDLSHDLDEVTAQFKRMVMEAVKEERARLQGRHRQEVRDMQDKYEAEKMELLRQRDECRQYWYQHRERNEKNADALTHRADCFALAVASRGPHSVWKSSPELQRRAFESSVTHRFVVKRNFLTRWRQWTKQQLHEHRLARMIHKTTDLRLKRSVFGGWRSVAIREAATAREDRLKSQVKVEVSALLNDHESEVTTLREANQELQRRLDIEAQHRGALEERLKIAFMRGVCALNLEAMQVMNSTPGGAAPGLFPAGGGGSFLDASSVDDSQSDGRQQHQQPPGNDTADQHADEARALHAALHYDPARVDSTPLPNRSDTPEMTHYHTPVASSPMVRTVPAAHAVSPSENMATFGPAAGAAVRHVSPLAAKSATKPVRRPPLAGHSVNPAARLASPRSAKQSLASVLTVREMLPAKRFNNF